MARLSALLCAALLLAAPAVAQAPVSVRVLAYNIRHGEGTDGRLDLARIAALILSADPDVVALQEVDQGTERALGVNQLDELAARLGMHAEFGKAIDYLGGTYGVAVLSRWPILEARTHALPASEEREPRVALTVVVRPGGSAAPIEVTSTHLDNARDPADRVPQIHRLNELLARGNRPAILAGDFNARSDRDLLERLYAHWTNALDAAPEPPPEDDGRRRRSRSDFVLFRPAPAWRVVEWRVLDDRLASDHRPVLAVLELTAGP